jgi:hypothetical protein
MVDMARKLTLLLIAACLPAAGFAQDDLIDEEVPEIKRYTVEIVVFSYVEDVSVGSEVFPADLIEETVQPVDTIEEIVVEERHRRTPDMIDLDPVLMTEEEFTMQDVVERLELLDAYEPILHVGWTQPGFPREETEPMELAAFGEPPEGLHGNFKLYLGNYLHLVVDLAIDAATEIEEIPIVDDNVFIYGDVRPQYEFETEPKEGPVRYRIQENRIVKNGEIRYFDHPKFGVIAKVTRVEVAEDSDEDERPESQQLLGRTGLTTPSISP